MIVPSAASMVSDAPSSSTLSKITLRVVAGKLKRNSAAWSVGAISVLHAVLERDAVVVRPGDLVRRAGTAARASSRSASGAPVAADGITWKVWRSPIHGLGSWLSRRTPACVGRLSALLSALVLVEPARCEPASVTGVQKLKPCGTAVAGMLLPREKPPLELVPRVVSTQSDGCACASAAAGRAGDADVVDPAAEVGAVPSGLS